MSRKTDRRHTQEVLDKIEIGFQRKPIMQLIVE